jgi:DNA-binding CsgD family transcriptional regulator/outer membrane murein-binding lipoprotein Lpp
MLKYFTLSLALFAFSNILFYERKRNIPEFYIHSIISEKNNSLGSTGSKVNNLKGTEDSGSVKKDSRYLYCVIYPVVSLIVFSILVYYCYRLMKKKKQSVQNKEKVIDRLEQDIEQVKEKIQACKMSTQEILRVYILMVRLSVSPQRNRHQKFLQDYNSIIYDNNEEFRFESESFRVLLNNICNNYIDKLESAFPVLSEKEVQVISMLKAGFDISDIANISGYSVNTIYKRNSDIRRKLGIPESGNIIHFTDHKLGENQYYIE